MPGIDVHPTADITVAYVNPPKEGKRNGSIKTSDGQYYAVREAMLSQFSKGMKCRVEYKTFGDSGRSVERIIGNSLAPQVPKNDYRARSNPVEAKQIAVLALAKECIGQMAFEQISEASLIAILTMCARAYDKTLAGAQAQRRDDMDDEIPY